MTQLGAQIREARQAAGISQERLAPIVGTTRRHLIRLERGDHYPRRGLLRRLAETLNDDELLRLADWDGTEG